MKPSGMSEATTSPRRAAASAIFDELCRSAAELLDCEVAVLLYSVDGVKRGIGSHGLAARYKSYEFDFAKSQYGPKDRVAITDLKPGGEISATAARLGIGECGFFLREPVLVASKISAALLVFGSQPHAKPTPVQRATLTGIVKLMRKELGKRQKELADPHSDVTITGTLADIRNEVDTSLEPRALLDANLTIIAASKSLCALLAVDRKKMVGRRHAEIAAPASEAIGWLYAHALATRVSPPEFEVVSEGKGGIRHVFRINVAPFSPDRYARIFPVRHH